jgi:hypothetical protein
MLAHEQPDLDVTGRSQAAAKPDSGPKPRPPQDFALLSYHRWAALGAFKDLDATVVHRIRAPQAARWSSPC